jgi:DNA-binding NarL/FixJ family response regulator
MLHDIIREIVEAQPDMHVVADLGNPGALASAVAETRADFVIYGVDGDVSQFYPDVIEQGPAVKVLAVQNDDHQAILWKMRPSRAQLGELSPGCLLDALRSVGHA